ncbi:MAG: hypothetical protein ACRD88_10575, partial [Terriglobia bacterium]
MSGYCERRRIRLWAVALVAVLGASNWALAQNLPASLKDEPKAEEQDKAPDITQPAWPVSGIYTAADTK